MRVFTLGFTQKKAERFFGLLQAEPVTTLLDVRLNNVSQLAGFAKRDDLRFFLRALCDIDYVHVPEWAPTQPLLQAYKKKDITWEAYEDRFMNLLAQRQIEKSVDAGSMDGACLLCSEHEPHHCHRRLLVEYLNAFAGLELQVKHLK